MYRKINTSCVSFAVENAQIGTLNAKCAAWKHVETSPNKFWRMHEELFLFTSGIYQKTDECQSQTWSGSRNWRWPVKMWHCTGNATIVLQRVSPALNISLCLWLNWHQYQWTDFDLKSKKCLLGESKSGCYLSANQQWWAMSDLNVLLLTRIKPQTRLQQCCKMSHLTPFTLPRGHTMLH